MFATIKLEARDLAKHIGEMAQSLDVHTKQYDQNIVAVNGDVFELATLVERHETGNWDIPLDEVSCGHDHMVAEQMIDAYVI